jgi:hypothetical protein
MWTYVWHISYSEWYETTRGSIAIDFQFRFRITE